MDSAGTISVSGGGSFQATGIKNAFASAATSGGGIFTAVGQPGAYLVIALVDDHYHLLTDHHDLVAAGTEIALAVAFLFVGGRMVLVRLLGARSSASPS
jgi:hypothetical protein